MKPTRIEYIKNDRITINYRITEKCNYKCPYCYFDGREPKNLKGDLHNISNVLKNLRHIIDYYRSQDKKIFFFLTGGEPSLYPLEAYEPLFEYIDDGLIEKLTLSTNFSADAQWFIEFSNRCKNKTNIEIKAAYHPSETTFESYYQKIEAVKNYPNRFIAHFTFDDNNFIGMEKINQIKDLGVLLDVVPIHTKGKNFGEVNNVTNPDLIALCNANKNEVRNDYVIYFNNNTKQEATKAQIKEMDFSKSKPKCYHSNISIMHNRLGINCEYMRSIGKIIPNAWKDIGSEILSAEEIYNYLQNECVVVCDKQKCNIGSNCAPNLLQFSQENLWQKILRLFK